MAEPSQHRIAEVQALLSRASAWAAQRHDIRALALVGSWARGTARQDSDVDLILLSVEPETYVDGSDWLRGLAEGSLLAPKPWGAITERRLVLTGGLELDIGIGTPSWAGVSPADQGTQSVVARGFGSLYDPDDLLARLAEVCGVRMAGPR